jgi:hypothetical protein
LHLAFYLISIYVRHAKKKRLEFSQNVDEIYAAYTNADFIKAKLENLGARHIEVEINEENDEKFVKIIREVQVEAPGVLKRFVNVWNKMTQTERWRGEKGGPYYGEMNIEIANAPVIVKSTMQLESTEDGCIVETMTSIRSNIPFLGHIMDNFMGEMADKSIEEEFYFISENV